MTNQETKFVVDSSYLYWRR